MINIFFCVGSRDKRLAFWSIPDENELDGESSPLFPVVEPVHKVEGNKTLDKVRAMVYNPICQVGREQQIIVGGEWKHWIWVCFRCHKNNHDGVFNENTLRLIHRFHSPSMLERCVLSESFSYKQNGVLLSMKLFTWFKYLAFLPSRILEDTAKPLYSEHHQDLEKRCSS